MRRVDISIASIYEFATGIDVNRIRFILAASDLNSRLSDEGMNSAYGLEVGRTLKKNIDTGLLSDDLLNSIVMYTAAASDAAWVAPPAGHEQFWQWQPGIAATVPVVVTAKKFNCSEEQLARALIMSHLGAIYIKSHYPPLSAFCGNTVTSAAAAMAMVYLAGGEF